MSWISVKCQQSNKNFTFQITFSAHLNINTEVYYLSHLCSIAMILYNTSDIPKIAAKDVISELNFEFFCNWVLTKLNMKLLLSSATIFLCLNCNEDVFSKCKDKTIPDIHSPIGLKMNLYASTLLSCKENLELKTIVFSIAESVGFYSLDYIL